MAGVMNEIIINKGNKMNGNYQRKRAIAQMYNETLEKKREKTQKEKVEAILFKELSEARKIIAL